MEYVQSDNVADADNKFPFIKGLWLRFKIYEIYKSISCRISAGFPRNGTKDANSAIFGVTLRCRKENGESNVSLIESWGSTFEFFLNAQAEFNFD